jgi:hypothetical protein
MKQPRGGAAADLLFFLFFLVVLGVVWALTDGPKHDLAHAGPFLNLPFPFGSGNAFSIPSVPIPTIEQVKQNSGAPTTNESLSDIIARMRGAGGTKGASPYAPYVTLSATNAQSTDPGAEYLTLRTSSDLKGQLAISNWRIESAVSALGAVLGPASYLPISGSVGTEVPVSVGANTTLYIVTGRSPEGESFRENLCTGYFRNGASFTPYLTQYCPRPNDEFKKAVLTGFIPNDACVNYVNTLGNCQLAGTPPIGINDQCATFLANALTYNGCVTAHKADAGFYKNSWYIYLDRDQELWKSSNEQIRLLDESGKVVAPVSY